MADAEVVYDVRADYSNVDKDLAEANSLVENKTSTGAEKLKSIAGTTAKAIGAGMLAAGTAVAGIGVAAVNSAVSMDQAMNSFISSTGKGTEESERYQNVLENIYQNNYGEDFQDIADAMGSVSKQLGDMDDTSLQTVTESAFALRDTFEYDISESTRAAKAMMDNFGTSGEEAMSLIAAGAQNGLDYSGELIDSISEYSTQFAKVGLDADDMFKIFQTGADTGAWNLDKIGDAVKEMSIRVIDGSDTTKEGFELIGLNADDMAAKFAAGGDSAKEAFQQTIDAIASMEDPLAQNTAGVDLFGTMWEDLGPEVVTQLAGITDGAYDTADAMNGIKEVQYDDLGSMFEGLKRSVEMLILPLGEQLIPLLSQMLSSIMPVIQQALPPLVDAIGQLITQLQPVISQILPVLINLFTELMPPMMELISAILPVIVNLFSMLIPPITQIISAVLPVLIELMNAILPIFQVLIELLEPIISLFMQLLSPILQLISEAILPLVDAVVMVVSVFADMLKPVIEDLGPLFSGVFSGIFDTVSDIFGSITGIINGIIDFIKNVFSGNWKGAWQAIVDIFGNIFDGIVAVFKIPINFIIGGINSFIRQLNKIKIPDWVPGIGGKGLHIDEIAKLRVGMEYVPEDDFPAFLHKGEAVLTAQENALYRSIGGFEGIMRALSQPAGNGDTYVTMSGGDNSTVIDYDKFGKAAADAFVAAGISLKIGEREFGRIEREAKK